MSHLITNEQKLNDIIFADRNKEYGAYVLRSEYGYTVFKSLSMMLAGVGLIASVAVYMNQKQPEENLAGQIFVPDSAYSIKVNIDEPEESKAPADDRQQATTTEAEDPAAPEGTTIVDSVRTSIETSTNTTAAVVGSVTLPGESGTASTGNKGTSTGNTGSVPDTTVAELFTVDSQPEFEGGFGALARFISRNLKYPETAYDLGKEGIVVVKFIVDENGNVGKLRLLNSAGYGMDEEALRVVGLIPKFKTPAKVRGIGVKSYYQMPIRFRFR